MLQLMIPGGALGGQVISGSEDAHWVRVATYLRFRRLVGWADAETTSGLAATAGLGEGISGDKNAFRGWDCGIPGFSAPREPGGLGGLAGACGGSRSRRMVSGKEGNAQAGAAAYLALRKFVGAIAPGLGIRFGLGE